MGGVTDRQARQRTIRRDPRAVTQPRPVPPASAPSTASSGAIAGKIIAVNALAEDARLAPMISGDPRELADWADNENFDTENAICCWTMGIPVCDVGWPGVAVLTNVGWWLQYPLKLLPDDAKQNNPFCAPDGTLSPALPAECDPFADPGICSTKYGCCLPAGDCLELNEVDCAASGGLSAAPGTDLGEQYAEYDVHGRHCITDDDYYLYCLPLHACVDPANPTPGGCSDVFFTSQCPPGTNSQSCSCQEYFQGELGCP